MYYIFTSQYKYTVNVTLRPVWCRGPAKANAQKPNTHADMQNCKTSSQLDQFLSVCSLLPIAETCWIKKKNKKHNSVRRN